MMTASYTVLLLMIAITLQGLATVTASSADGRVLPKKPHIILILADDLGWSDISWNNEHVFSPNLEALARTGIIFNQSYVLPRCTPSRSSLMTGMHTFNIGRQHGVLDPLQPTGLTLDRQILPQLMKDAGYSTHIVGKWHLGYCSKDYIPTKRGFDSFLGFYLGGGDYYDHTEVYRRKGKKKYGYDFRNNTSVERSVEGKYSTEIFSSHIENLLTSRDSSEPLFLYVPFQSVHVPLQVPEKYELPFADVTDAERKTKLGMIHAMDEAVGKITNSLKDTGHYDNSIIIFTSDNGGPIRQAGYNWPLRGEKGTIWEGGTRVPAFVHSNLISQEGVVSDKLTHITDWFPTIVGLAGGEVPIDTDGYDQWDAITTSAASPRSEMIYTLDITDNINAGVRKGDYKLLVGANTKKDSWAPPPENNAIEEPLTPQSESDLITFIEMGLDSSQYPDLAEHLKDDTLIGLFHIKDDPEERKNLALQETALVHERLMLIQDQMKNYVKADYPALKNRGKPKRKNNVWTHGWCNTT